MKKLSILFAAVFAVTVLSISWKTASDNAAAHITDFGCALYNANGHLVLADASSVVITNSGNVNFKCQASGVENNTGKAVRFDTESVGKGCNTQAGPADQWQEVISASGQATLICKVKPQ